MHSNVLVFAHNIIYKIMEYGRLMKILFIALNKHTQRWFDNFVYCLLGTNIYVINSTFTLLFVLVYTWNISISLMIKTVIHKTITDMITSLACVYLNMLILIHKYSFKIIVKLTNLTLKNPQKLFNAKNYYLPCN